MRNGDYSPTRMANQLDAALMLVNSKRLANIESAISVMTMGGQSPHVLVTLTNDQGKLEAAISGINYAPGAKSCNVPTALQVAQLVLKNRQNSNQHQRIVLFNGSPLIGSSSTDVDDLSELKLKFGTLGKILRKNGIAVDIVSFGGESITRNEDVFRTLLVECASITPESLEESDSSLSKALSLTKECECGYLAAPPGRRLLDVVKESQVYLGYDEDDSFAMDNSGYGGMMDDDMMDDMDPELAMALKMSLDEENARINRASAAPAEGHNANGDDQNIMADDQQYHVAEDDEGDEDEDLAKAIAMSMEQNK